jgi:hypothetical protein
MPTDLTSIKTALEALTDMELNALAIATYEAPQIAPGLLAWIDAACHWDEPERRKRLRAAASGGRDRSASMRRMRCVRRSRPAASRRRRSSSLMRC